MRQASAMTLLLFCAAALGAEGADLTLVNGEAVWLYYAVDPVMDSPAVGGKAGDEGTLSVQKDLSFSALAPGGSRVLAGLAPGNHTILGFWTVGNAESYGVFSVRLAVDKSAARTYTLRKTGTLTALERKTYDFSHVLPDTALVIDGAFADWDGYPAVAVFPRGFQPSQFAYQSADGLRNLPIRNAVYWGKGGTELVSFKALAEQEKLFLCFNSTSPFAPGLSIYFYVFDDRKTRDVNLYTVEIAIGDEPAEGAILLWTRGKDTPASIGNFRAAGAALEGVIDLAALPEGVRAGLMKRYSFDLKTGFHEKGSGFYEEYFFTSRFFSEIYSR